MPKRQFDEMLNAFYSVIPGPVVPDIQAMNNLAVWTLAWSSRQEEIDEKDKQIEDLLQKLSACHQPTGYPR